MLLDQMSSDQLRKIERLAGQDVPARDAASSLGLTRAQMAKVIRDERHTDYRGLRRMVQQRRLNNLLSSSLPSVAMPALPPAKGKS